MCDAGDAGDMCDAGDADILGDAGDMCDAVGARDAGIVGAAVGKGGIIVIISTVRRR